MMVVMVIAAKSSAARYGPGRLVVDGTDRVLRRKTTFAFNPAAVQQDALHGLLGVCCEVYNAGLAERRDAWRSAGLKVSLFDQFGQLTELRGVRDDVFAWGVQPLRGALRRLDEAYGAFLRRCAAGQAPGLPRFRSRRRFDTACWDEPSSWRVDLDARALRIQGGGRIRLPKSVRRQLGRLTARGGTPVTLTITRKRAGGSRAAPRWVWRATVGCNNVAVVRSEPAAGRGSVVGGDRGVAVTLATSDGALHTLPRWMADARDRIVVSQQRRARKRKGSRAWRDANRRIAREHRKVAARSDNWARD
nr:transposase [Euzebyaceae bacterium]